MNTARTANLLGAFTVAMHHRVLQRINADQHIGGEGPAAVVLIGTNPGKTVDFVARALELTHSGTVRLIDRLATEQWVERRPGGTDRRAVALYLTKAGQQKMRVILRVRRECLESVLGVLSAKEQKLLTTVLEGMLENMTTNEQMAESICRLCEEEACPQPNCPVTQALQG